MIKTLKLFILLLPLTFFPFADQIFEIAKYFLLSGFILIFSIYLVLNKEKIHFKIHKIDYLLSAFIISLAISTLLATNIDISFFGGFFRHQGFVTFFILFLLYFFIRLIKLDSKKIDNILMFLVLSSIPVCIIALFQNFDIANFFWDKDFFQGRAFSLLGHPSYLGQYIIMLLPFCLYFIIKGQNKILLISLLIIQLYTLLLSGNRASILAIIIAIGFFIFLYYGKNILKFNKHLTIGIVITPIILFLLLNIFSNSNFIKNNNLTNRLVVSEENMRSVFTRFYLWEQAIGAIKEDIFFGKGLDSQRATFSKFMNKKIIEHELVNKVPSKLHNEALDLLYSSGILGFGSYYIFLFFIFYYFIKHLKKYDNKILIPILSSILAYTITNQFGFPVIIHLTFFYIIIGLGVIIILENSHEKILKIKNKNILLIISILLFINFYSITNQVLASSYFKKANFQIQKKNYSEANEYFDKIIDKSFRPEYQYYYINNVLNSEKSGKYNPMELIGNLIKKYPSYGENYLMKGRLLMGLGKYDQANKSFEKANGLAPMDVNTLSDWAYNLHIQGKYKDSTMKYKQLLGIMPEYFWNSNMALSSVKKEKNKIFHLIRPDFKFNFLHLSRNYLKLGDNNKSLFYLNFADQKSIDTLTTFGVIYGNMEKYEKALEYYKKALNLDPNNQIIIDGIKYLEGKLDF